MFHIKIECVFLEAKKNKSVYDFVFQIGVNVINTTPRPVTSLGQQEWLRVFWKGHTFF